MQKIKAAFLALGILAVNSTTNAQATLEEIAGIQHYSAFIVKKNACVMAVPDYSPDGRLIGGTRYIRFVRYDGSLREEQVQVQLERENKPTTYTLYINTIFNDGGLLDTKVDMIRKGIGDSIRGYSGHITISGIFRDSYIDYKQEFDIGDKALEKARQRLRQGLEKLDKSYTKLCGF